MRPPQKAMKVSSTDTPTTSTRMGASQAGPLSDEHIPISTCTAVTVMIVIVTAADRARLHVPRQPLSSTKENLLQRDKLQTEDVSVTG